MITIDQRDKRPIYEQIIARYEMLIVKGVLAADEKLPSVRQLAQDLAINPNTIQKAYAILEHDGYIYTVQGRGNFVSDNTALLKRKRERWQAELTKLLEEGRELGLQEEDCQELIQRFWGGDAK